MIKLENTEVMGWEGAIRGMRNPMNSWEKSDSVLCMRRSDCHGCRFYTEKFTCSAPKTLKYAIGPNDHDLMMRLAKGGPVHAKYRRQIFVSVDITAPLYWWKEFDTYKVGTTANSCSTMHKIHAKEFARDDFSHEHLCDLSIQNLQDTIDVLNKCRTLYLETKDKKYWWQMIQLLPTSYNQMRTVTMTYENLCNMYHYRKDHKLDEWHTFCDWIKELPYSEVITLEE